MNKDLVVFVNFYSLVAFLSHPISTLALIFVSMCLNQAHFKQARVTEDLISTPLTFVFNGACFSSTSSYEVCEPQKYQSTSLHVSSGKFQQTLSQQQIVSSDGRILAGGAPCK